MSKENNKPKLDINIEQLIVQNIGSIENTLTSEIKDRIQRKIKYDLGLGNIIDEWMQENVAPAVIDYFDNNKKEIIKKYLSAYEKALNKAMEKRTEDMVKKSTGLSFQKALKEL